MESLSALSASSKLQDLFHPLWEVDSFDVLAYKSLYAIDQLPAHGIIPSDEYYRKFLSFGRPLLGALLRNRSLSVDDVKELVSRKVPGLDSSIENDPHHIRALAMVSYRCQFFVTLQSLADDLCSSYLRFVADISDDRSMVRTLQPSEPLLAWIAADQMRSPRMPLAMVRALLHHTQRGFIDVGDIGELVSMIVLLLAFDRAQGAGRPRPVAVSTFFGALFPEKVVRNMDKRSKKDRNLQRVWNGSVFFSHFTRTQPKKRHVTLDTLRRAYARNAALLAPKNFEGCDLILPVLLEGQGKMSYVLIQVKNDKSLVQGSKQNEDALADLSPHKTLEDAGYFMGIWMSLRYKPAGKRKKSSNTVVDVLSHGKKIVAVASGLDETLYPALGELEDTMGSNRVVEKLRALLKCTDDINVPEQSRFLKRLYAIDDESL